MRDILNTPEPCDEEAEALLLAKIIAWHPGAENHHYFDELTVEAEDFYKINNRIIFETIKWLHENHKDAGSYEIQSRLKDTFLFEKIGGWEYLNWLTSELYAVSCVPTFDFLCDRVIKAREQRETLKLAHCLTETAEKDENWQITTEEKIKEFTEKAKASKRAKNIKPITIREIFDKRIAEGPKDLIGLPTGYPALDAKIGGFPPQYVVIIAGRPSMGKSAFALNLMLNAAQLEAAKAEKGKKEEYIVYYSLEQSQETISWRILTRELDTNKTVLDFKKANFTEHEIRFIRNISDRTDELPTLILREPDNSILHFKKVIREIAKTKKIGGIIVDHIGQMTYPGLDGERETFKLSQTLQSLGAEMNCVMFILSQLNRKVEERINKRPMLSDLRQSGNLEQVADVVMLLYRDVYYNPDTEEPDIMEVSISKNRDGELGFAKLHFNGVTQRIESSEHGIDPKARWQKERNEPEPEEEGEYSCDGGFPS